MAAVYGYGYSPTGWKKILLLRVGAAVADLGAALFLSFAGVLLAQMMNIADGTSRYPVSAFAGTFVALRSLGLSLGNATVGLRVDGTTVAKNFLRVLALLAPGYNVFDWIHALRSSQHRTFTDMKLGVRVVVDTMR